MKTFIYGAGRLGRQVYFLLRGHKNIEFAGFIDDTKPVGSHVVDDGCVEFNRSTLSDWMEQDSVTVKDYGVIVGIGPSDLDARWEVLEDLKTIGFQLPNIIADSSDVDSSTNMGVGNIILAKSVLDTEVVLGDGNYIDIGCLLSHNTQVTHNNFLTTGCSTAGYVKIGSHNFIGMNSTLTDEVQVGDRNFFSAKNFVTKDVTDNQKIVTFYDQHMSSRS
jgi:UDP-3-O-[3-hydroxymyristoyl] glucosamine N-acyltransferase